VAGLVYSYLNNYDIVRSAKFSMASSILALSSNETINSNFSISNINKIQEEI
jgi:pseudouridine kinase